MNNIFQILHVVSGWRARTHSEDAREFMTDADTTTTMMTRARKLDGDCLLLCPSSSSAMIKLRQQSTVSKTASRTSFHPSRISFGLTVVSTYRTNKFNQKFQF